MDTIRTVFDVVSYAGGLIFAGMFGWYLIETNLERFRQWRAERRGAAALRAR